MRNRNVEDILENYGYGQETTKNIVRLLIEHDIIEADKISDAEVLAARARKWVGNYGSSSDVFNKASGWNTESWIIVANDPYAKDYGLDLDWKFDTPMEVKQIFAALVILAKEAGIEL